MNKLTRFALSTTALAVMGTLSTTALAHSENAKPRYVAVDGIDSGKCEVIEKPCATISYAGRQANKGDEILMSAGEYLINDADSLFYMTSGMIPVRPGFSKETEYKVQDTYGNSTFLTGVPVEMADKLRRQGFKVNTDQKLLTKEQKAELDIKLKQFADLNRAQSNVACVNGQAGSYSCKNIDLLSHVPLSDLNNASAANDVWGFVDLNTQKEYALIGLNNGVSVVDVTVADAPVVVGSVTAQNTQWRDIKVHQKYYPNSNSWKTYAYATEDNVTEGLLIIDLTNLPEDVSVMMVNRTDSSAHNAFISGVDYSTGVAKTGLEGRLQIAGANNALGALKTFQIESSARVTPVYTPSSTNNQGYTHDISGVHIDDERVGTQCEGENGQCEILFDYNVKEAKIWNSTDIENPVLIGEVKQSQFLNPEYIHSGWTTEDNKVLLVHDELDESRNGHRTRVQLFDISDLTNPQPLAVWEGPDNAIDHNGYVRGNRYYMSHYERGLTVLDLSDPSDPTTVGWFDTFPIGNNTAFSGAWGVYPFLPSGNILVSDINSGLYVLKDNTVGTDQFDSVRISQKSYDVGEGENISIVVSRNGNSDEAVTVNYESHIGSASTDDFTMVSGTLSWAAGDTSDKTVNIATTADTDDAEVTESFVFRLFNPSAGLNLAAPNISVVNISGEVSQSAYAGFTSETFEAKEIDGVIQLAVNRAGDLNQDLTVAYSASGSAEQGVDYSLSTNSLSWSAGDNSTKFIDVTILNDDQSESTEQIQLNLLDQQGDSITQTIISLRDDESNQAPEVTIGEDFEVDQGDTINLIATASDPEGYNVTYAWSQKSGTSVTLSNDDASMASTVAPAVAGVLEFEVAVSDDFGVETTKSVSVTVKEAATTTPTPTPTPNQPSTSSGGGGTLGFGGIFALLGLAFGLGRRKVK